MHYHQLSGFGRDENKMASSKTRLAYRLGTAVSMGVIGVTVHTETRRQGMQQLDQKRVLMARPGFTLHRSSSKVSKPEVYHLPPISSKDHQSVA